MKNTLSDYLVHLVAEPSESLVFCYVIDGCVSFVKVLFYHDVAQIGFLTDRSSRLWSIWPHVCDCFTRIFPVIISNFDSEFEYMSTSLSVPTHDPTSSPLTS